MIHLTITLQPAAWSIISLNPVDSGKVQNMENIDHISGLNFDLIIIPPPNEVGGGVYWIHLVRPSVRPSVCLSVDDRVSGA